MFDKKRNEVLQVRLTKEEKNMLKEVAGKYETTMGSMLRELFNKFVKEQEKCL